MRITACVEDAEAIEKILTHLDANAVDPKASTAGADGRDQAIQLAEKAFHAVSIIRRPEDGAPPPLLRTHPPL